MQDPIARDWMWWSMWSISSCKCDYMQPWSSPWWLCIRAGVPQSLIYTNDVKPMLPPSQKPQPHAKLESPFVVLLAAGRWYVDFLQLLRCLVVEHFVGGTAGCPSLARPILCRSNILVDSVWEEVALSVCPATSVVRCAVWLLPDAMAYTRNSVQGPRVNW